MHEDWNTDSDNEADYNENGSDSGESQIDSEIEIALYGQIHHLSDLQNPDVGVLSINNNEILDNTIELNKLDIVKHNDVNSNKSNIHHSTSNDSDIEVIRELKGSEKIITIDDETPVKNSKTKNKRLASKNTRSEKKRKVMSDVKSLSTDVIILSSSSSSDECFVIDTLSNHSDEDISINISDAFLKFLQTDSNNPAENWVVDLKDKYCRSNQAKESRYYKGSNVYCRNCNTRDHLGHKCPTPKKTICYYCGESGHTSLTCKKKLCVVCGSELHTWKQCRYYTNDKCKRCGIPGHQIEICPDIWRQYYLTTKVGPVVHGSLERKKLKYCYNCAKKGHYGHLCPKQRMFRYISASKPFIIAYDDILYQQKSGKIRKKGFIKESIPVKRKAEIQLCPKKKKIGKKKKKKISMISGLSVPQDSKISSTSVLINNEMIGSKKLSSKQNKHIIFEGTDNRSTKASRESVEEITCPLMVTSISSSFQGVIKKNSCQRSLQNKKSLEKRKKKYKNEGFQYNNNSFMRRSVHFDNSNDISKRKRRKLSKQIQIYNPDNEFLSNTMTVHKSDSNIQGYINRKKSKWNKRKKKPISSKKKINTRGFQLSEESVQRLGFS